MPQFVNPPSFSVASTTEGTIKITFSWTTDVPTKAIFGMLINGPIDVQMRSDFHNYSWNMQVFDLSTDHSFTIERPIGEVAFYAIRIEADGQFNYYFHQMPQLGD